MAIFPVINGICNFSRTISNNDYILAMYSFDHFVNFDHHNFISIVLRLVSIAVIIDLHFAQFFLMPFNSTSLWTTGSYKRIYRSSTVSHFSLYFNSTSNIIHTSCHRIDRRWFELTFFFSLFGLLRTCFLRLHDVRL